MNTKKKSTNIKSSHIIHKLSAVQGKSDEYNLIADLTRDLNSSISEYATSEGFESSDIKDYFFLDIEDTSNNMVRIEVRAELSYDGLVDLGDKLDKVIELYDSYAYFEPVQPGITEAYIDKSNLDSDIYGSNNTTSTSISASITDFKINRIDKSIKSYNLIATKRIEDIDGFLTDYSIYAVVLDDNSIVYECYLGDTELYGPWNGEGLDFESDNNEEATDWYNNALDSDVLELQD